MSTDPKPPLTGEEIRKRIDVSQWYIKNFTVEGEAREVFEKYCGLAPDQVQPHVGEVRDKAFENMPYACIGSCRFLNFSLSRNPHYKEVLDRLLAPGSEERLLDLGCCFGHDLRKVTYDGVPAERLYGIDADGKFIDLGHELFLDKDKFKATFIVVDMFKPTMPELLEKLGGGVDFVYAASFFQLFNWQDQVKLAINTVRIMKPRAGSMVLGRQLGNLEPGEFPHLRMDGTTTYWHNAESWQKLWDEVGEATDSKWKVEATMDEEDWPYAKNKWGMPTQRRILFAVYRQ